MPIDQSDWQPVTFGDVVQEITDHEREPESRGLERYVGLDHLDPGDPRIRRWGMISEGVTFTKVFRAGQILFGKRRVYQKKMGVPDFDGLCSGDIIVLDTEDQRLSREFLALVVQTEAFFAHAEKTSSGSLSPRTKFRELAKFEFLLPPPQQQRELVELMQGFERAIEAGEESEEAAKRLKAKVVESLFSSVSTMKRLGDFVESSAYGPRFSSANYSSAGNIALIRTTDMDDEGKLEYSLLPLAALDEKQFENHLLEAGDFLITRSGTCGIASVFEGHTKPTLPGAFLIRLRLNDGLISQYLRLYINSEVGRPRVKALEAGAVQRNISASNLVELAIPVPSPEVQKAIVSRIEAVSVYLDQLLQHKSKTLSSKRDLLNSALSATAEAAAEVPA